MNTYAKIFAVAFFFYAIVAEIAIYAATHHITLDPFISANGSVILVVGGVMLFMGGLFGLMEGFWD